MTGGQRQRRDSSGATRLVTPAMGALAVGAIFGAVTSLVNALSGHFADLESREATSSGASPLEVISVLLDSGWAWAGLAVATGWLVTRTEQNPRAALATGAAAGALALIAATTAYSVVDTIRGAGAAHWYQSEPFFWWVAGVVFGPPLGAIGACIKRPTMIGLLARLTVPVGAAAQMLVLPPGRNDTITTIGQAVVGTAAAASIVFAVSHFFNAKRRLSS
ncbi:hypothetical protein GCM10022214_03220 [Actinomadura miaoliensis]|uniref:Integral membrane protein n=1 Tax=Actinomadura miaoliensis TaxID=430685 RepID=A0ABP7V0B9_9ACTN